MTTRQVRSFMSSVPRPAVPRSSACVAVLALAALAGCGRGDAPSKTPGEAPPQVIGPENVAVARTAMLRSGPPITGTLTADREARLRAEVAGAVLETRVEPGERVAAGDTLARIDDAAVRDAAQSARSGVAQATIAAEQAARELARAKRLGAAGAIADRDVESADRAAAAAQAQLEDARARLAGAEKALRNTVVRAPFDGVVSERVASVGDIVAPGAALFTVVDPRTLRVEAAVPASALGDVRVGAPVLFTVNGSDRTLEGRVTRISPVVDPQTRQVRLLATVPNGRGLLVAGLFVEGRIASERREGVLVPAKAVDQTGLAPTVVRLRGGKVERVEVQLGLRDEGAELMEVRQGLAAGDTVLLGAARGVSVGTSIVVSAPSDAPAAPAAVADSGRGT